MGDIMKKKFILLVICFITFISGVCSVRAKTYDSFYCNEGAAKELIKILVNEVGEQITPDQNEDFFAKLNTAAVIMNNAIDQRKQDKTLEKKIYNLRDGAYAGHSTYKNRSYESIIKSSGVDEGKMVYIAELVLSGNYTLPKNMTWQAAGYLLRQYGATTWTYVNVSSSIGYDVHFGYNGTLANVDVMGNKITNTSPEYYRNKAKSLMKSDYSNYKISKVCKNNLSGGSGNSGSSGNSSSGDGTTTPNIPEEVVIDVPTCENPEVLRVIYFITLLIDIVKLVVPIGLVIVGMIDFSKGVVATDEGAQKKVIKIFVKRVIYAILIFAVLWIVKTVMVNLGNLTEGVNFTDCLENANKDSIAKYDAKLKELEEAAKSNTSSGASTTSSSSKKDFTIYIGDSRTVGMCSYVSLSSSEDCSITKGGEGYPWLTGSSVSSSLDSLIGEHPNSYIVINMGTNSGLSNSEAKEYATFYNSLASKYTSSKVVAVSVTQVDPTVAKASGMYTDIDIDTNSVSDFNKALKKNLSSSVKYCDVYSSIANNYRTIDGVHYDENTYKSIYNAIKKCLD